jgi:NnrU protein
MSMLIAAAAVFLAIHLLVAGTRARDGLVSALGENAYLGLFSLVSAGVIVWMVVAYNAAQASGNSRFLYDLGQRRPGSWDSDLGDRIPSRCPRLADVQSHNGIVRN